MRIIRKIKKKIGIYNPERFVIICHQRSGSNMLTSMMDKHADINFIGQLFKADQSWQQFLRKKNITEFTGKLFDDSLEMRNRFDELQFKPEAREKRNTEAFLEDYFNKRKKDTTGKIIGIKFHGGTLYNEEIKEFFIQKEYKVILLHRENMLASAISWYRARTLDQWTSKIQKDIKETKLKMDIKLLEWFIENTKNDLKLWRKILKDKPHIELTYEQIVGNDFNFSKIWEHLEVRDIGRPVPKTKKLIKSYEDIENIEEVRSYFNNKNVGMV